MQRFAALDVSPEGSMGLRLRRGPSAFLLVQSFIGHSIVIYVAPKPDRPLKGSVMRPRRASDEFAEEDA
jgi:hypothetical protein